MKKRILSMLLVIAMLVSLGPVRVFAAPSLPQNRLLGDDPVIHQNPLYPDAVYTDELVIPEAPVTTQDVSTSDYKPLSTIAVEFREQMKINSSNIILHYHHVSNSSDIETAREEINDAVEELFHLAFTHTGDPKEGDYLRWRWLRYSVEWSGSYSGKDYYIDINYTMEYITTAAQESKVDSAVDDLLDELNLDRKTDYQKIRGIYDWLCNNVSFDYENQNDDSNYLKYTAYAALINGKAIAPGYALLFYRLALELGVDNRFILGLGNGDAHAWNIVELDNLYYNLDSTMDASNAEAGLDYEYFLLSDANFHDHTRSDDYTTSQFNRDYPMASQDYDPSDEPEPTEPKPTEPKPTEPEPTEPEPTDPGAGNVIAKGKCGQNINWTLSDSGLLRVSGSGATYDYEEVEDIPWVSYLGDVKQIYIDSGITAIGSETFVGLENATSLTLPSTLTTIGDYAFMSCEKLSTLTIPSSVTTIGKGAFANWLSLRSVVIPNNVTKLDMLAFNGCTALESVTLGSGMASITAGTFRECTALRSITIPANITAVGIEAFRDCSRLSNITFEGNAPSFSTDVFLNVVATAYYPAGDSTWTSSVRQNYGGSITWTSYDNGEPGPSEPTEPDDSQFCGENLTWNLSGTTLTISGSGSMYNWDSDNPAPWYDSRLDITKVVINSGVTTIGDRAFAGLEKATSVSIPSTVTSLGEDAFFCCVKLTSVSLPDGLTSIGKSAFGSCNKLTSINIPGSVKVIGDMAFSYCDDLTSVTLHEGLEVIDMDAFLYCDHLPEITIPSTVHTINYSAFGDCTALTKITFLGDAPTFGQYVFDEVVATVYYPANNKTWTSDVRQDYGGTLTWVPSGGQAPEPGTGPDIADSGYCGDNLVWDLTWEGVLTISGTGPMYDWPYADEVPWHDYRSEIKEIIINNGVTYIGENAFFGADAIKVTIPNTVTRIGAWAFASCSYLKSITIPSSVKEIGIWAFSLCEGVKTLVIPDSVEIIDHRAFMGCSSMETVTIGRNVSFIGYQAFSTCFDLSKIYFTGDAPEFDEKVFENVAATAYYPKDNRTWFGDVKQSYSGQITWFAYDPSTVDTRNPFTDVKKSDYYYDAVIWAVENGITAGTSANKFSPNATCTRGQVVTFLWRAAGMPEPNTKVNPFSDVKSSDYFYKAVLWAVEKGITSGTGNGKFSPNAPCTRAQVATFLWRAEGEPDASGTNPFSDVRSSEYYYKAVLWAVENGITAGTSATKFSPNAACTRGQIVTFLYRAEH